MSRSKHAPAAGPNRSAEKETLSREAGEKALADEEARVKENEAALESLAESAEREATESHIDDALEREGEAASEEAEKTDKAEKKAPEEPRKTSASDEEKAEPTPDAAEVPDPHASNASGTSGTADPRRAKARRWAAGIVLFFVFAAAAAAALWWWAERTLYRTPAALASPRIEITVKEGQSAQQALDAMRAAGVTLPAWQVRALLRLEPGLLSRIHVGRFRFTEGMTPFELLKTLSGPALVDQQVRIPDGAPVWEAVAILADAEGLTPDSAKMDDRALLKTLGLEEYASLEGFLAPETYRYGSGTSDLTILKKAVERQKHLLDEAWASRNERCRAKSAYELLILASIIEKETGEKSDRHLVSSVFNNRLRIGMALQTDPTVIYGLGAGWSGRLRRKDLEAPTPWNTYTFVGFPPTPISMPSAASIEAAAHPADTKYLYFVARGDGTSEFSTNLKDHNRAVQHFIIKKRTEPLKK